MKGLLTTLGILGIIAMALAQVSGMGYGLYLWAHESTFAVAAWQGFVLGLKFMGVGFTLFIIGLVADQP